MSKKENKRIVKNFEYNALPIESNEYLGFIAGYTSNGFAYGLTHEQMNINMDLISHQMQIRLYHDCDWDSILDIFMRAKPDELYGSIKTKDIVPLNKDEGLMNSFNNSAIYVAEFDNKIYGYVGYHNNLISFLFVDPLCYRKGIGTKLIEYILPLIGEKAWLLVAKTNEPAIKLYYKYGFKIAEEFIGKYNNKIEVGVLRLAINPDLNSWK